MAFPSSPSGTRMRQRCTVTPRENVLRTCGQRLGAVGELRLHLERGGLVDRRDLPEDVVGLAVQLRELQVARLELVRASWNHRGEQQRHGHEQERALSHGRSVGSFASMLTSYSPRILA